MNVQEEVKRAQKKWAERCGKEQHPTRGDYLDNIDANLRQCLSARALEGYANGDGSELRDTRRRPAKMKALNSSSVLAANFFDYWTDRDKTPLLSALDVGNGSVKSLDFEPKFPTGLRGNPPNPDYAIWPRSGGVFAIESKFIEWVSKHTKVDADFRKKYLRSSPGLWTQQWLFCCQELAEEIGAGKDGGKSLFQFLDAAQLLKHALGLATIHDDRFSLYYLYYDWPGERSEAHRDEIERFAARVGDEIRFKALSYQDVYKQLRVLTPPDSEYRDYLDYLRDRYFSGKGAPK